MPLDVRSRIDAGMAIEELGHFDADLNTAWHVIKQAIETLNRSQQIHGGEALAALHAHWSVFHDCYSDHRHMHLKRVDEHAGGSAYLDRRSWPIEEPLAEPPSSPAKAA